jgi:hypothetical protein
MNRTYLIRGRFDLSGRQQDCELINAKVTDTDAPERGNMSASLSRLETKPNSVAANSKEPALGPVRPHYSPLAYLLGETCSLYGFHLGPSRRNIRPRETRVMDEVQIHVFDAKLYSIMTSASS